MSIITRYRPTEDSLPIYQTYNYVNRQLHGPYIKYFKDGTIAEQCTYDNGNLTGFWRKYYPNGTLAKESYWIHNKQHGMFIQFNEMGEKEFECPFVNGQAHGNLIQYKPDGPIACVFVQGKKMDIHCKTPKLQMVDGN